MQRTVNHEVRINCGICAARALDQIPETARGERHIRRAQRLLRAIPLAEFSVIALATFHGERFPRGIADRAAACGDAEQRLRGVVAKQRVTDAARTEAEAE